MGSIHGTFIKLKHLQFKRLLRGQTYQIGGTEIFLNIIDVQLPDRNVKIDDELENNAEETFMRYLEKEYNDGTQINGLPKESYL